PAQATRLSVPGGASGRIGKPYDVDDFVFSAKRGAMYTFEVQARRYGSSLDSVLTLQDMKGKTLASNDDAPGIGKDSRLDWTAPADSDYILQVSDLNSRGGETYVYPLTGMATIDLPGGGKEAVRRIAEPMEEIYMPGGGRSRFPVDMHTVSVTEPSDIIVKVNPARVSLAPGGSASIDVEVARQTGYD